MASFASLTYCKLLQPSPWNAVYWEQALKSCKKSSVCKHSILCRMNKHRVFPVSSDEVKSGVAPSWRRYVRNLQRCRSPPSLRFQERPEPSPLLRWRANLAESQRCRPWLPPNPPDGTPAREIFAEPSALFHKRRIRHGAHPYFQFLTVGPFSSARGVEYNSIGQIPPTIHTGKVTKCDQKFKVI